MKENGYERKNQKKKKVKLPFHVIFGYLLVTTLIFTGIGFAKYSRTVTGDAAARVAAFVVGTSYAENEGFTIDFSTGTETEKEENTLNFTISNHDSDKTTETLMKYSLVVTLPEALPDGLMMKMGTPPADGGTEVVTEGTVSADKKVYTFSSNDWTFLAGTNLSREHTIKFSAVLDSLMNATTEEEIILNDIEVKVVAEQMG